MKISKSQIKQIIREQTSSNTKAVYLTSEELWHTLLAVEKYRAVGNLYAEEGKMLPIRSKNHWVQVK